MKDKKPLYRKMNSVVSFAPYHSKKHQQYKHVRNTKKQYLSEDGDYVLRNEKMKKNAGNDYDYKPLFRFLQSKVGQNWDKVYSEAKSRLDKEEPIWELVQRWVEIDGQKMALENELVPLKEVDIVRLGESIYFRALYVDENNILQFIDKDAELEKPDYNWTHTLDGKPIN